MKTQRQYEINGTRVRRPVRPSAKADDGLYRYVPVPPVGYDEDGYPVEDGMSQNRDHQRQTSHWCSALTLRYPNATVCSDLIMPYERGDKEKVAVPDLLVALNAPLDVHRRSYKLWENPTPDLVMEMISPDSTWKDDVGSKYRTYQMLGIREYWLFDATGKRLTAPVVGYRLCGKVYQEISETEGRLESEVLGLDLYVRNGELRFHDPETGKDLTTHAESEAQRDTAEQQAQDAKREAQNARREAQDARRDAQSAEQRAQTAEDEVERLRVLLEQKESK